MLTPLIRSIRTLRRSPAFVIVATLSLAVGIALSTSTFAIVDTAMRPKIPLADIDRLFRTDLRLGNQRTPPPVTEQVRALEALPGVEAVAVVSGGPRSSVTVDRAEGYAALSRATPNVFAVLGVAPRLGRLPTADEVRAQGAVVVSASAWHRLFANRPALQDASLTIDGRVYPVVGVLPSGVERLWSADIWLPGLSATELQSVRWPLTIVKLRRGADSLAMRAQLATVAANFTAVYAPPPAPAYVLRLTGVRPAPPKLRDSELFLLMTGIALGILAIAFTNVTALALARGLTRRRDYALRVALGASTLSIAVEVLAEVGVLTVAGAAVGFLFAIALVGALTHMVPEDLAAAGFLVPVLSARVFAFTALSLAAGLALAGGVPAWRASRIDPSGPLKDGAGTTTGRGRSEFKLLVMAELAVAMALLMLTSLVSLSTRNLAAFDFGYDARRLVIANVGLPTGRSDTLSDAKRDALLESARLRIAAMRGVTAVSRIDWSRLDGGVVTPDDRREAGPLPLRTYEEAGPNLFLTLGSTLTSGRDFTEGDAITGAVILSPRAAALLFPHGDAVGRSVRLGDERSPRPWLPVIGIARDVHLGLVSDPDAGGDTIVYAMTPSRDRKYTQFLVRVSGNDLGLGARLRGALLDGLPSRAFAGVQPFLFYYDQRMRLSRFFDQLFSFLGFSALFLGATGLFSVLSYTVGQRLREFAVRQALGAAPMNILRLVLRGAFELALGGTAFGALLSFWASAGVSSVLFGVKNTDPVSLVLAEVTLMLAALLASLVPAARAMRTDPVEVLRAT